MATLFVSEYGSVGLTLNGGNVAAGKEPRLAAQSVAVGVASAQSDAFQDNTRFIRVHTDVACYYKIGSNPTAVATEGRLAANQTEYFGVNGGDKIAVIQE